MQIPRSIKVQACKRLLHYYPVKTLAKELNISHSSVQNWVYFINRGYFDWRIDKLFWIKLSNIGLTTIQLVTPMVGNSLGLGHQQFFLQFGAVLLNYLKTYVPN